MNIRRDINCHSNLSDRTRCMGRNVIAVIGIDRYQRWLRLENAVRDAASTLKLFHRLGFEQIAPSLLNETATGKAIQSLVTDDLMALGPDDSLVLFYAGHGGTRTYHVGDQIVKTGYLIPVDAEASPEKAATWVELDGWLHTVSLLPARHILVVIDACHSGIALARITRWRDLGADHGKAVSVLSLRRSRRIITSALDDQAVLDDGPRHGHSLFTGCLLDVLTYGAGSYDDRVMTGSELWLSVRQRVQEYPNSSQTPDFGAFGFDDRGEMVIPLLSERDGALPDSMPPSKAWTGVTAGPQAASTEAPTASPPHKLTADREVNLDPRPRRTPIQPFTASQALSDSTTDFHTGWPGSANATEPPAAAVRRVSNGRLTTSYAPNPAWLVELSEGRLHALMSPTYINFGPDVEVATNAVTTKNHLHISAEEDCWYITAHGCRLTTMNTEPTARIALTDGQTFQVGPYRFVFRCVVAP